MLFGGIEDLVFGVHQEAFAIGVGEDQVDLHGELAEQPPEHMYQIRKCTREFRPGVQVESLNGLE